MPRFKDYHRPTSVAETLKLLSRTGINTAVLAGGTSLVPAASEMVDEVVDLQQVGLKEVDYTGKGLTLGAMVRLQTLAADDRTPSLLREVARREQPSSLRSLTTVGGTIASPCKESEFVMALLVFETTVRIETLSGPKTMPLAEFLIDIPAALSGGIITSISLATMGKTAIDRVARTPADRPIVAAAARLGDNDQLHLALCGVANTPVLIDPNNVKAGVNPASDFRGSREYRRQMAATLANRVVKAVQGG
jgi:CO/xanthine dehydrogenase FAD-binding subunit